VARRPDPADRRGVVVGLTPAWRSLIDAAVADHVANEARLLAPLTAAERDTLDSLVRKLLAPIDVVG
jgi:DNA-binding MarR family transcriptional regulator